MGADTSHTVLLDDERASDPRIVGSKAATLARLRAAGFRVPPAIVIPVASVQAWLDGDLPDAVILDVLGGVVAVCGPGRLAVRSSAGNEDLVEASFAGMYATILDVYADPAALRDAVAQVASSHRTLRVQRYQGEPSSPPAVMIQPMVDAETAGVAFTADPVTGDRDAVRVSAVAGTGERLVAGEADPDEWEVRDGNARRLPGAGPAVVDADVASGVAAIARTVAEQLGAPQDVEWARADEAVVILQARPITVLPTPPTAGLPGDGWQKDLAHYPEPITPFGASLTSLVLDEPMQEMTATYGLLVDRLETRVIGGEVYVRPVPVIGPAEPKGPTPPAWLLGLLCRVLPPLRQRMAAADRAVQRGLFEQSCRRWRTQWRPQLESRIAALLDVDLQRLDDRQLDRHVDELVGLARDGARIHFLLFVPYLVALKDLCDLTRQQLGWEIARTMRLLTGSSPASVAGQRELDDLRAAISADDDARAALAATPADPIGALHDRYPELAERVADWIRRHGWRTLNYDAGSAAIAERPALLARLLLFSEPPPRQSEELEEYEAQARHPLDPAGRARFAEALTTARDRYGLREENVVLTDSVPSGLLRRWVIEAGERLVQRRVLTRSADAAYLTLDELRSALTGQDDGGLAHLAVRRRSEEAWVRAHPGPAHVGRQAPPPDVSRLPAAARRTNAALLWGMEHEYPPATPGANGHELRGTPASPGVYEGPVRIVRTAAELDRVAVGDVLVAPVTTPSWTVAFDLVGAVVTDGGGALSHAAIVAREYGIPAVLGTVTATSHLRDGQIVTVDGTTGTIRTTGGPS